MPVYCYKCPDCEARTEKVRPMKLRDRQIPCACGFVMVRDRGAERVTVVGKLPTWTSMNAGVHPSQVAEARKEFAHLDVKFNNRGDAVVPGKNRMKFLKERGLIEVD